MPKQEAVQEEEEIIHEDNEWGRNSFVKHGVGSVNQSFMGESLIVIKIVQSLNDYCSLSSLNMF